MGKLLNAVVIILLAVLVFRFNVGGMLVNENEPASGPPIEMILELPEPEGQSLEVTINATTDELEGLSLAILNVSETLPVDEVTHLVSSLAMVIFAVIIPMVLFVHLALSVATR
ncbi:hypothetical protein [Palaeococcus ferrophilus]|uniref:hypothetical protein n=1 Tax=Palaeococcus ferrophilus TaxID=83868 RepID=UPI00064F5A70|nr:hypothetical protein [Palaeococcus ferrophilus]